MIIQYKYVTESGVEHKECKNNHPITTDYDVMFLWVRFGRHNRQGKNVVSRVKYRKSTERFAALVWGTKLRILKTPACRVEED